jgi:hypothetical protein
LSKKFGERNITRCTEIIGKYKERNDLRQYEGQQWHLHNPNLKYDFFKRLDNNKSGYYFGLLLADGTSDAGKNIGLFLEKEDIKVIERFRNDLQISNSIEYRIDERIRKKSGEFPAQYGVRVGCKPMMEDLKNLGFFRFKSGEALEDGFFTNLNENVSYSVLMGFYDGDGEAGSSKLSSTNRKFLEQVKREFNVKNNVRLCEKGGRNKFVFVGYYETKDRYTLALGGKIYNRMIESYEYSMERKRRHYPMGASKNAYAILKDTISDKANLEMLNLLAPRTKIAETLGYSFVLFKRLCDEYNIKPLHPSHWNKTENANWEERFQKRFEEFNDKNFRFST